MLRSRSAILQNALVSLDWNDLRYFLAVARGGSTLAACKELRVSQTTVARRITALEEAIGLSLFERRPAGYALTPSGEELLAHAEAVEAAALNFASAAARGTRDLSGTVRITTEEIFAVTLLAPLLRELHDLHPEILIELDTAQAIRDLGAGEADIALRSTVGDQAAGLVGRRICVDDWTLYCSADYAARNGVPANVEELRNHTIIGGGGGNLWKHYQAWLQSLGLEDQVAMHHASSTGLLSGVRSGFGIAVLPCIVADAEPDLIRCAVPRRNHERVFWLLTHERVRNAPRVRTVIDFLYERQKRHVACLPQPLGEAAAVAPLQRQA
jgi:DNA-binding transcriptional LysR family regulator